MTKYSIAIVALIFLLSFSEKASLKDVKPDAEGYHLSIESTNAMKISGNAAKANLKNNSEEWKSIVVTASAYNSLASQTNSNPAITAFGDTLKPGMKCIAVSPDLLIAGLKHNTRVRIEGMEGEYVVNDKMPPRWTNHIDIYMGIDVKAALQWGRRKVRIEYFIED